MANSLAQRRLSTLLLGIFASIALVLATVGLYGVMSYAVAQRTREIGIRMAIGAVQLNVLRMILNQGMLLIMVGLLVGLTGAFALTAPDVKSSVRRDRHRPVHVFRRFRDPDRLCSCSLSDPRAARHSRRSDCCGAVRVRNAPNA